MKLNKFLLIFSFVILLQSCGRRGNLDWPNSGNHTVLGEATLRLMDENTTDNVKYTKRTYPKKREPLSQEEYDELLASKKDPLYFEKKQEEELKKKQRREEIQKNKEFIEDVQKSYENSPKGINEIMDNLEK
ncbi:MAG: hypothetical protein MJ247_06075 [Alphaproteobacteria bacterium]|nr:hypothetical protein [Alphaproteobacteria bacterium]